MTLGEYLALAATRPWDWGSEDCSTFPADWIFDQTGADPMEAWRHTYVSEGEAHDLIAQAGGLVHLFGEGIDQIWHRVGEACEGAVGVISLAGEDGAAIDVGAIHTGKRWAIKSPRGLALVTAPLDVRAIWAK